MQMFMLSILIPNLVSIDYAIFKLQAFKFINSQGAFILAGTIDRCISTYLNFSMSSLLIHESVGELHHDNCTPSLLKRNRRLATPDRNNASKAETWKS